jgi:hypothetical protein
MIHRLASWQIQPLARSVINLLGKLSDSSLNQLIHLPAGQKTDPSLGHLAFSIT